MKTAVMAEKPSVGRDIAKALGCRQRGDGFIEGDRYVVTWALGHLVTLAEPEDYDPKYKKWEIDHLPIMPSKLQTVVIPQTSKQYKTVKDILMRRDVSDVVVATDAGREGELVARWIIEKAGCEKPLRRLWISSVTEKAIKDGFNNLKDGKLYRNLCDSAKARAEADWLVGINATRCLTAKYNGQLSCGRVQTPTVAIIVKREEEIRNFTPRKYYGITAAADGLNLTWTDRTGSSRCFERETVESVLKKLSDVREGVVTEVTKSIKKKNPPKLYDLTELQRDANKRFGYTPKETLSIAQRLYEEHKALTYPRTDSRHITADIAPTLPDRLRACSAGPYKKICAKILSKPLQINNNFADDSKVTDHHAIIPTEQFADLSDFNERELKVYGLVVTRFLSVFYPPYEYERTSIKVKAGSEIFTAAGRAVISLGYREIFIDDEDDDEDEKTNVPRLLKGDRLRISSFKLTEGKTSPPPPFTEATLLSAMENPAKYMETRDDEIAEALTRTGGLGTVATRADIIEKLFDNFLIEKKGKEIFSTSKGRQLLTLVPERLKSPELTGEWEQKLTGISSGSLDMGEFLRGIRQYTSEIITEIKNSARVYRHDNLSTTKCPGCGKFMLQVKGKKGEMLVCQDRECNQRINVSIPIRSRCPHCNKFLNITGDGDRKSVACACGYREKYSSFERRKQEESGALSKKDVQAYIERMNKDEEKNNPFAALKGMKFDN